jgi:hypothetical protein
MPLRPRCIEGLPLPGSGIIRTRARECERSLSGSSPRRSLGDHSDSGGEAPSRALALAFLLVAFDLVL